MAKEILHPIGSPVEASSSFETHRERMAELNRKLDERRDQVRAGWGEKYVERVHAKGKMTTWERIEALKDPGSRVYPVGTFVNYGLTFGDGEGRTSPAAGVITAFVQVEGRHTVVLCLFYFFFVNFHACNIHIKTISTTLNVYFITYF